MLVKYDHDKCNIKSCVNPQYKYLICEEHYERYIVDEVIKRKLQLLNRIVSDKATRKDKIVYYLNYLKHYITSVHVSYIEHYPLETIFLYHKKKIYRKENINFNLNEFIDDFNYVENKELDEIKVYFHDSQWKEPFVEFENFRNSKKITKSYLVLWIISISLYSILSGLKINIPYQEYWLILLIIGLFLSIVVYSSSVFSNKVKNLVNESINNNFLKTKEANKEFLKSSFLYIYRIKGMNELLYNFYGALSGIFGVLYFKNIYELFSLNIWSIIAYSIMFFLSYRILVIIVGMFWDNRHLLKIVHKIPTKSLKFNLYNKNEDLGISTLKKYIQSLIIYNISVVATLSATSISLYMLDIKIEWTTYFIISFFFAWNLFSNIFLIKLIYNTRKEFVEEKTSELIKLNKTNSAQSYIHYNFINNLKLNILDLNSIKNKTKKLLLFIIPLIIGYLMSVYSIELEAFNIQLLNWLKHLFIN